MNIIQFLFDNAELIFLIALVLSIVLNRSGITSLINRYKNRQTSTDTTNVPLIMAYYTQGHALSQLATGKINNMRYAALMTTAMPETLGAEQNTGPGALIYTLNLPFNTQAHIVGVSQKYAISSAFLESYLKLSNLEEITLEGDFPNTFSIFAEPGQDVQVRYILDPKAMQFAVDYCASNFWEIAGDEMYIVATADQKGSMDLVTDSTKFVEEIRPRFNKPNPGDDPVHHETPYGEYDGDPLQCPICQKTMVLNTDWQTCPANHGILINGRYVIEIRYKELAAPVELAKPVEHGVITCPNCHNQMQPVNYQQTGVIIDSCNKCPFRWLDSTEAAKIISKV